jgi:hypothetical protein
LIAEKNADDVTGIYDHGVVIASHQLRFRFPIIIGVNTYILSKRRVTKNESVLKIPLPGRGCKQETPVKTWVGLST